MKNVEVKETKDGFKYRLKSDDRIETDNELLAEFIMALAGVPTKLEIDRSIGGES